jgi:hypothetical protein
VLRFVQPLPTKKTPPIGGVFSLKTNPNFNTNAPPFEVRGCKYQNYVFLKNDLTFSMKFSSRGNGSSKTHGNEIPVC